MRPQPANAWKSWPNSSGNRCRPTGLTWRRHSTTPAGRCCPRPSRWSIASTSPSCSTRPSTLSEKKITRAYKAKLPKAQRKEFRALLWEFRRNPQALSQQDKQKLEGLFRKLPRLRTLHEFRLRFQRIFDTTQDRRKALRALVGLFLDMLDFSPALDGFIRTFEQWQEEILN